MQDAAGGIREDFLRGLAQCGCRALWEPTHSSPHLLCTGGRHWGHQAERQGGPCPATVLLWAVLPTQRASQPLGSHSELLRFFPYTCPPHPAPSLELSASSSSGHFASLLLSLSLFVSAKPKTEWQKQKHQALR